MEEPACKYDPGSWSEWVHLYINATSDDEVRGLLDQLNLQWLQIWTKGLIGEFEQHFGPQLLKLQPESPEWKFIIDGKWPPIGVVLAQLGAFRWARLLYKSQYSILCRVQAERGRVHKGTPLHQIGWVELVEGTRETLARSKYFMKLALIEDVLTVGEGYRKLAAFRVLQSEHYLAESVVVGLADAVKKWLSLDPPSFDRSRPELIYLDIVRDSGNSEESDYFHFNPDIATYLLEEAKRVDA